MSKQLHLLFFLFLMPFIGSSQKLEDGEIKKLITKFKADVRGPYKDIRWFCPDSTIILPREQCADIGGKQHARYKAEVASLAKTNHIFLGQILTGTDPDEFWDAENYNSRLKQYQLEKYLRNIDNGWVQRRGQYYRGAFQIQDEETWGIDFFTKLLRREKVLKNQFYLLREAVKNIPHQGVDTRTEFVRSTSKIIGDSFPAFMKLRTKIHGQPDEGDLAEVIAFKATHEAALTAELRMAFEELIANMELLYQPVDFFELYKYLNDLPRKSNIRKSLETYIKNYYDSPISVEKTMATAEKIEEIRTNIFAVKSGKARLALLDISIALEAIFLREIIHWSPETLDDLLNKICYSGLVVVGTGLVEEWEWDVISPQLEVSRKANFSLENLLTQLETSKRLVEWGSAMPKGVYQDVIELYGGFEPLVYGFYDDRIRSSVLLNLGQTVSQLGDFLAREANFSNEVMGIANQSAVRGLNPGYAKGELVVIEGATADIQVANDKIYVFESPPSGLKPVAGIATVSEGNSVSHIQLLARNLGIPNAVLSSQNLQELKAYAGQSVFYAVSNKGTVILKSTSAMTAEENGLFATKKRTETRVNVPIDKLDLSQKEVLNMREINATASGKICGPKAANLAQLKELFPENVVEGIVIPFGVFRQHLIQKMPGQTVSYWRFLEIIYKEAEIMRAENRPEAAIEAYILKEFATLRTAFTKIRFRKDFMEDLETSFEAAFGKEIGKVPVFVRSDTNMEDLNEFTGAGLNKTLFNVVSMEDIRRGIREVWASPFTERSYKWRQRYLLNPENVFPSILIIPSVDVEYSGVLVTKGISTGDYRDLTVAFSRGAGGAVDGQAAETWLLKQGIDQILLSPAREPAYRRLPLTGGTSKHLTTFESPILNHQNRYDLRLLAYDVQRKMPYIAGIDSFGPFDIELGFKEDKIWLFQIRPFVENKNAAASEYLASITPKIEKRKKVSRKALLETINP